MEIGNRKCIDSTNGKTDYENTSNVVQQPSEYSDRNAGQQRRQISEQNHLPRTSAPAPSVVESFDWGPGLVERNFPKSVTSPIMDQNNIRGQRNFTQVNQAGQEDPYNQENKNRWIRVPVNKWRVNFNGDIRGPTVTQFSNRIDILAKNNDVTDHALLCQAFFFFKEGSEADKWYYTFCHKFSSWTVLKHHLRLRFEQPNKDRVIERQMHDRRQIPSETFNAFFGAIEKLAQQLSKPMSEGRKLEILMENIRDTYKPFLTIYRIFFPFILM